MGLSNDAASFFNKGSWKESKYSLGDELQRGGGRASGKFTTAGGDVNEVIPVAEMLATDIAIVQVHTKGATPVTIVEVKAAAGQIEVELSADPSTDHVLSYVVLKA